METYLEQKKKIQHIIVDIVENDKNLNEFTEHYEQQNYKENKEEFKSLLYLITRISENHHRGSDFNDKIEHILLQIQNDIQQNLTNNEIFNLFCNNKKILLFLIQKNILIIDELISKQILEDKNLYFFFYPEIKPFIDNESRSIFECMKDSNISENFAEKRQEGENDSEICSLIRNDSIQDFIVYINQKSILPNSTISNSIFETNQFLIGHETTLIEYAAFFGSIQIFKYLHLNKAELQSSLWNFAIHGQNPEIIEILIENKVEFDVEYLNEAIKCHHIQIAYFLIENFKIDERNYESCFRYYNYEFFPNDFNDKSFFNYLCQYDYFELLKITYENEELNYKSYLRDENIFFYLFF